MFEAGVILSAFGGICLFIAAYNMMFGSLWAPDWHVGAPLMGCVIGLTIGPILAIAADPARERFMVECLQHRPQYECTAMWRAGESSVVPMPIVVPMRTR